MKFFFVNCLLLCLLLSLNAEIRFFPEKIPDSNNDGTADEKDFVKAFNHFQMSPDQIFEIFTTADHNRDGSVDEDEWSNFYDLFVVVFEECDTDRDYMLDYAEIQLCSENISSQESMIEAMDQEPHFKKWDMLLSVLSNRGRFNDPKSKEAGYLAINLEEWIFLRRAARVWKDCVSNTNYITKAEIRGCAVPIMVPYGRTTENEINQLFEIAMTFSQEGQVPKWGQLRFIGFLSLFRRFHSFKKLETDKIKDGALTQAMLLDALHKGILPTEKFDKDQIIKLFSKQSKGEKMALDFKSFFLLSAASDSVSLYGETVGDLLNLREFQDMLYEKTFPAGLLEIIDNIKYELHEQSLFDFSSSEEEEGKSIDQLEEEFLNPASFLQIKSQRRLRRSKTKGDDEEEDLFINDKAREFVFNMFVVNEEINYVDKETEDIVENAGIDSIDLFNLYVALYHFKDYDPKEKNLIYPEEVAEDLPKNYLIHPSKQEKSIFDQIAVDLDSLPIDAGLYLAYLKRNDVFEKIAEEYHVKENKLTLEALNKGLSILGLSLDTKNLGTTIVSDDEDDEKFVRSSNLQNEETFAALDENTLFDYETAFKNSARNLAKKLKQNHDLLRRRKHMMKHRRH